MQSVQSTNSKCRVRSKIRFYKARRINKTFNVFSTLRVFSFFAVSTLSALSAFSANSAFPAHSVFSANSAFSAKSAFLRTALILHFPRILRFTRFSVNSPSPFAFRDFLVFRDFKLSRFSFFRFSLFVPRSSTRRWNCAPARFTYSCAPCEQSGVKEFEILLRTENYANQKQHTQRKAPKKRSNLQQLKTSWNCTVSEVYQQ